MRRNCLVALMALCVAFHGLGVITSSYGQVAARPGTPAANFADDNLLKLAERDVGGAFRDEITLLTDHVATCSVFGTSENEVEFKKCVLTHERYRVAYADDRPLDKILFATDIVRQRLRLYSRSSDRALLSELRQMQQTAIPRLVEIERRLSQMISMRNRELAKIIR